MRFLCDSTVGKLARLLRTAGFDTAYIWEPDWRQVVRAALGEERVVLSRNSLYSELKLAPRFFLLHADNPEDQFLAVATEFALDIEEDRFLSRCLECNSRLIETNKERIRGRLWTYVAETQEKFFYCEACDKIYWHATHARAITQRLLKLKGQLRKRDS
jgi:hypothetical protein